MSSPNPIAALNPAERLQARLRSGSPKALLALESAARDSNLGGFRKALVAGASFEGLSARADIILAVAQNPSPSSLEMLRLLDSVGLDLASPLTGHATQWVSRAQYPHELAAKAGAIQACAFLAHKTFRFLSSGQPSHFSDFDDSRKSRQSAYFSALHVARWAGSRSQHALDTLLPSKAELVIDEISRDSALAFSALRLADHSWPCMKEELDKARFERYEPPMLTAAPSPMALYHLIRLGAPPNDADSLGQTALHKACSLAHLPSVNTLLNNGANPNAIDINGDSPLGSLLDRILPSPRSWRGAALSPEDMLIRLDNAAFICKTLIDGGARVSANERALINELFKGAVSLPPEERSTNPPSPLPEATEIHLPKPESLALDRPQRRIGLIGRKP